jgi:hypothetical protein
MTPRFSFEKNVYQSLRTYRLPTDELDYEVVEERTRAVPITDSEAALLETHGLALIRMNSSDGPKFLALHLKWRVSPEMVE